MASEKELLAVTPAGGVAYTLQCLPFSIAVLCTLHGAWQIWLFTVLEMAALAVAYWCMPVMPQIMSISR